MASDYENYLRQLMTTVPATGTVSPTLYAPARTALENQFTASRDQLQSTLPAGGQLNSALANLILQRGQAVGNLDAQLLRESLSRAPQVAQLGMGMEQANRQRSSSMWGGLGSALGILSGLALGATGNKNRLAGTEG